MIVALSECNNKGTECANKQELLLNMIHKFALDETEQSNENDNDVDDISSLDEIEKELKEAEVKEKTNLPQFYELHSSAECSAKEACTGAHPNAYYCPQFVTPFLRFAKYYVLWTNIIVRIKYQD